MSNDEIQELIGPGMPGHARAYVTKARDLIRGFRALRLRSRALKQRKKLAPTAVPCYTLLL